MAASGFTPLSLYYSATTTNAPTAGNLVNGELAINIIDGKLFYKDNSGVVQVIATKSATSGIFLGTGAITVPAGTTAQEPTGVQGMLRFNTTTTIFEGYNGTVWGAIGGGGSTGVSSFSGGSTGFTPNTATTGAVTLAGTLAIANGGTNSTATATAGGAGYGTGTAHAYTAAGTSGQALISAGAAAPAFGALAIGTANTNISGALTATNGGTGVATLSGIAFGNGTSAFTAASTAQVLAVVGTLPAGNGGTGITAVGASGNVLTSNGTAWTSATPASSAPTTAQVGTATAGFAAGDIGSYMWAAYGTSVSFGTNYAGTILYPWGVNTPSTSGGILASAGFGTARSGTWKAMGSAIGSAYNGTLFLRIA